MILSKAMKQICLTAALVVLGTTVAFAADAGQATGTNVNVRQDMTTEAEVLGKISKGNAYTITGQSGGWFQISYEGMDGYVSDEYFEITQADATITGNNVNVRKAASSSADVLGKLNQGDSTVVTGQSGSWYRISYNGSDAYISSEFVTGKLLNSVIAVASGSTENAGQQLENTYGVITASTGLKLRKEASTISKILTVLPYGTEVDIDRVGSEWVRVITDGGQKGYVSAEFLSIRTGERTSRGSASSKGAEVVAYAKQFIGTPYVWGDTNLSTGVDCSGFVYAVMKDFGITLNRSSSSMAANGVEISKDQLQAGDLVFFNSGGNSRISHVGIYMGDGNYIHSTDGAAYGVTVTGLNSGYSANTYVGARRVLR